MKALALPFIALLLASCVSEYFTVNDNTSMVLYGKVMSEIDSVEVVMRPPASPAGPRAR